jgi:hypothetical protein
MHQVLEHVANPHQVLDSALSLLAPDGIIRITTPRGSEVRERLLNPHWLVSRENPKTLNAIAPLEHINCFSGSSLQYILNLHNLKYTGLAHCYRLQI